MPTLQVFDPAMCCSTGVCGPQVDPALPQFASDLEFLGTQGIQVTRFNLAQEPGAFAADATVKGLLQEKGNECLPLLVFEGKVVSEGVYPDRQDLMGLVGLENGKNQPLITPAIQELIALAVATIAHSDQVFRHHYDRAHKMGIAKEDMVRAIDIGLSVQDGATNASLMQVRKYLGLETSSGCAPNSGCC